MGWTVCSEKKERQGARLQGGRETGEGQPTGKDNLEAILNKQEGKTNERQLKHMTFIQSHCNLGQPEDRSKSMAWRQGWGEETMRRGTTNREREERGKQEMKHLEPK